MKTAYTTRITRTSGARMTTQQSFQEFTISRWNFLSKIETGDHDAIIQQTIPPSLTHEILSACYSSSAAGHLGVATTTVNIKQRFYWPGLQKDTKLIVSRCPECQNRSGLPENIIIPWWNCKSVIIFNTLEMIS